MSVVVVEDVCEVRFLHHVHDRQGVAIQGQKPFRCHVLKFLLGLCIQVGQASCKPEVENNKPSSKARKKLEDLDNN